jgi:hypothetical protein
MAQKYKRKIQWYLTQETLNQVYRNGLEYAFVSKDYRQVCPFVYCKDFLQDAIMAFLTGTKKKIYGFSYDPDTMPPLCTDRTRMIIACSKDRHFRNRIPNLIDFLNQIEDKLNLKKSTVRECADPPEKYIPGGIWLLDGSHRWMISPPMISMYALFIRIGLAHEPNNSYQETIDIIVSGGRKPYGGKDKSQLVSAKFGINKILKWGDRKIFHKNWKDNYPTNVPLKTMHHFCGIIGFSKNYSKSWCPYWHRKGL